MKKSALKLLLFLLPMLLVWAALETFYRAVPNNYTVKYDNLKKSSSQTQVLLLGSSHCFYALNPDHFTRKAYNLANISQSMYFDYLLFERYLDQMPKLEQVVLCIEYSNLSRADGAGEDAFRKYYYQAYLHLDVPLVKWYDPKKYSLALTRSLEQSMESVMRYKYIGNVVDCNANGWGNNYPKAYRFEPSYNVEQRVRAHEDGSLDFSHNVARIAHMAKQCKARGIELVIVSLPQTRLYLSKVDPVKFRKIVATCSALDERYDNLRYLNLFADPRFEDAHFFDADHLNDVGAVKCSRIVDQFLEQPNL